jgi:hypothetical protein
VIASQGEGIGVTHSLTAVTVTSVASTHGCDSFASHSLGAVIAVIVTAVPPSLATATASQGEAVA